MIIPVIIWEIALKHIRGTRGSSIFLNESKKKKKGEEDFID